MKSLNFFKSFLLLFILFSNPLFSQDNDKLATKGSLEDEILKMDSLLFNVAFNECDLELYVKVMSPNLEFYDDRSGLNTSFEKEIASFKDRCSKPFSVTRKLVSSSVHILGDYGAMQKGVHEFYVDNQKVEQAKFIHVWERKETSWIVKRAISYDHLPCSQQKEETYEIGQKSVTFIDESRDRPLRTEIWYPTLNTLVKNESKENQKNLFKTIATIPNATIPNEKFPLLLVSHGTGGNRFSLTWFIERMVKKGYIVVSLDHYGNSTFNKIPREFVKWWERAIDIQFVLTNVLNDNEIGSKVDTSKIGGVGFSLGGYTNIALAGGYVDRAIKENEKATDREMPSEFPKTDEIIDFENDSLIVSSYNKYKSQVKDDRIKAFFVMAPAIGFGFHSKEQTVKISAPIFIVAGKGDTNTPIKNNAEIYHKLVSTSTIHLFDEHVGHYVFLNEATEFGKEVAPEITIDKPMVDRKKIHEKTLALALDFFNKVL